MIEEKLEGRRRRGGGRKQLLDYLKETGVTWNLKDEALDLTLWIVYIERDYSTE
jgi:hypothetical protein